MMNTNLLQDSTKEFFWRLPNILFARESGVLDIMLVLNELA